MNSYERNERYVLLNEFVNLPEFEGLVLDYQLQSGRQLREVLYDILDAHHTRFSDPYYLMEMVIQIARKSGLDLQPILQRMREMHRQLLANGRGNVQRGNTVLGEMRAATEETGRLTTRTKERGLPKVMIPEGIRSVKELHGQVLAALVTVRKDEYEALLSRFDGHFSVDDGKNLYECACIDTPSGQQLIAICRCHDTGNSVAQAVTANVLTEISPPWILVVGIAGGFPDTEFTLGDVIVANRLSDFSVTAALEGRVAALDVRGGRFHRDVEKLVAGLPAIVPRMGWPSVECVKMERPTELIGARPTRNRFYGSSAWQRQVHQSLSSHFRCEKPRSLPSYRIAPNASANVLMKDAGLAEQWKNAARSVASVEMELAGVYEAVHDAGNTCRLLGIRGISDIVGYRRNYLWTDYASHAAASFARALLSSGAIRWPT